MTGQLARVPTPGFANPVFDSQRTFRSLLDAMARPGTIAEMAVAVTAPAPLSPAAAAIALTLFDHDTPVWLDEAAASDEVISFLAFHCGCPITADAMATSFAVIAQPGGMPSLDRFSPGSDAYPDSSTTLVIDLPSLDGDQAVRVTGPGIDQSDVIAPAGLPDGFWKWMAMNRAVFPLGIDLILTSKATALCLPRTTKTEAMTCT